MNDYLTRLAIRSLNQPAVVQPRLGSVFEPPSFVRGPTEGLSSGVGGRIVASEGNETVIGTRPPSAPSVRASESLQPDHEASPPLGALLREPQPTEPRPPVLGEEPAPSPIELLKLDSLIGNTRDTQRLSERLAPSEKPAPEERHVSSHRGQHSSSSARSDMSLTRLETDPNRTLYEHFVPGETFPPASHSLPGSIESLRPSPVANEDDSAAHPRIMPITANDLGDSSGHQQKAEGGRRKAEGGLKDGLNPQSAIRNPQSNRVRPQVTPHLPTVGSTDAPLSTPRASAPTIRVTIGRVEVRAVMPPPSPTRQAASPRKPKLSLDEYLRQRDGGKR